MKPNLDGIDIAILNALQDDARVPYIRLAQDLGISDTTVRSRVNRLIKEFVKFAVDIDPADLGLLYFWLGIRVQGPAMTRAVDRLSTLPEIIWLGRALGGYDLITELVCRDNADMVRVLDEIRSVAGVVEVDTYTVLSTEKESWNFAKLALD